MSNYILTFRTIQRHHITTLNVYVVVYDQSVVIYDQSVVIQRSICRHSTINLSSFNDQFVVICTLEALLHKGYNALKKRKKEKKKKGVFHDQFVVI